MVKHKYKEKSHFSFNIRGGVRLANVVLRKTLGKKYIFTLTDLKWQQIYTSTSGAIGVNRRLRRSPYVVEPMFRRLLSYLKYHGITQIRVYVKMRFSAHVYFFFKQCSLHGIGVNAIIERYSLPHNGVRKRKQPRK